ncbi:MAG: hypothetical protein ACLRWQ_24115 [Flavonifractor plautii]
MHFARRRTGRSPPAGQSGRRCGRCGPSQDRRGRRYAVPLGNKSSDVLCLGLALSLRDIAAPLAEDGPGEALFRQFHADFPLDGAEAERAARPTRTGGRSWPLRRS